MNEEENKDPFKDVQIIRLEKIEENEDDEDHKPKLISFPKVILDKLEEYKKLTGINPTDYIRTSLIKQMVMDKLIFFRTEYIIIKKQNEERTSDKHELNPNEQRGC